MFTEVSCTICGSDKTKIVYRLKERYKKYGLDENELFNVVKCIQCGLVYVNPRLSDEKLKEIYTVYLNNPWDGRFKNIDKSIELYYRDQIFMIEKVLKNTGKTTNEKLRVLDFACGWGHFLGMAKNHGWVTYGVELDSNRTTEANRQNLNVFNGTLQEAGLSDDFFDVITAFQVLEHMTDPSKILCNLRPKLRDKGVLVVAVPNYGSLESKINGKNWQNMHPVEHIFYFDFHTLKRVLEKNGFRVIKKPYIPKFTNQKTLKKRLVNMLTRSINISENLFCVYPRGLTVFAQKNEDR